MSEIPVRSIDSHCSKCAHFVPEPEMFNEQRSIYLAFRYSRCKAFRRYIETAVKHCSMNSKFEKTVPWIETHKKPNPLYMLFRYVLKYILPKYDAPIAKHYKEYEETLNEYR